MHSMVLACAVCFGQSDSPLAKGTNMGIFFMLGVTTLMLASFAAFFIYLIRRKRLFADDNTAVDSVPAHERTV
jgi:hypothetical protein